MKFLEKDLEQIIFETNNEALQERGLWLRGKKIRQLKVGNYGIADIVTIDRPFRLSGGHNHIKGLIQVVELKKDKVGVSAFMQALGYAKGISSYLEKRGLLDLFTIEIVLVGKHIDKNSSFIYLADLMQKNEEQYIYAGEGNNNICISCYDYDMNIDGLTFKEHSGYKLIDEGFNTKNKGV